MKDCIGRELNIGDEVAFSVGTSLKTGTVVKLRTKQHTANWGWQVAKVCLTTPEIREDKITYVKNEDGSLKLRKGGLWDCIATPQEPRKFRDVEGTERIILLKAIDNSVG